MELLEVENAPVECATAEQLARNSEITTRQAGMQNDECNKAMMFEKSS